MHCIRNRQPVRQWCPGHPGIDSYTFLGCIVHVTPKNKQLWLRCGNKDGFVPWAESVCSVLLFRKQRLHPDNDGVIAAVTVLFSDRPGSRVRDYPEIFSPRRNGCLGPQQRPARCLALRHSNWQVSLCVNSQYSPSYCQACQSPPACPSHCCCSASAPALWQPPSWAAFKPTSVYVCMGFCTWGRNVTVCVCVWQALQQGPSYQLTIWQGSSCKQTVTTSVI